MNNELIKEIEKVDGMTAFDDSGLIQIELDGGDNSEAVADQILAHLPLEVASRLAFVKSDESAMIAWFSVK